MTEAMGDTERATMLNGLMARGITREQAESELVEIERDLAYLRSREGRRQLSQFYSIFGPKRERPVIWKSVRDAVYAKTDGACVYCQAQTKRRARPSDPLGFTVDHVMPLARGGSSDLENLEPCCRRCNTLKSTMTGEEFRQAMQ